MKLLPLLLLSLSVHTPAFAGEGGSVSGGADYQLDMSAWFTGDDPSASVKICVEAEPGYLSQVSMKEDDLLLLAKKSFEQWAQYYERIGGTLKAFDKADQNSCVINGQIRNGYRIVTRSEMLSHCDGSQDLSIYFGVQNPEIDARKRKYDFPFAFSELNESYGLHHGQAAWSKGFIWIANPKSVDPSRSVPLWTNYGSAPLEMVLLHEMGHVFGNEHIAGTIMDPKIGQKLLEFTDISRSLKSRSQFNPVYLNIDQNAYLVFVPELGLDVDLSPRVSNCNSADERCTDVNQRLFASVYKALTFLDLLSPGFSAHLTMSKVKLPEELPNYRDLLKLLKFSLTLEGDQMQNHYQFNPLSILNDTAAGNAFRDGCRKFTHNQVSVFGNLVNADGVHAPKEIVLNVNTNFSPIEIIDPGLGVKSDYCRFYLEQGLPCSILSSEIMK